MKLVIATGIFPPDIGGPASFVPRLAGALVERGDAVQVITLADPPAIAADQRFAFPVHRIDRSLPRAVRMVRTIRRIAACAREADVLLANGLYLEAVIAARLARRPAVAKVVGDTIWERARHAGRSETLDDFQTARLPWGWRLMRALQDAYLRAYDRVITPSAYLQRIVRGWGVDPARIEVVYNAVPPAPGAPGDPARFDIVSSGRLVPWKHFAELIDIAARNRWSLCIVGDGPLRDTLEARARASGAAVTFAGHLPQSAVAETIRSGRVFVLNSSYEGLPHIVLEAMAAGVPVVATAAGGTPETIVDGTTGRLVPVGDTAAMERAIGELLADDAMRARLAAEATVALARWFSFEQMIAATRALLARTAGERRGVHEPAA